jgi:hypothetical protein
VQRESIEEEHDNPIIQLQLDDICQQTEEQIIESQHENINLNQEFYETAEELNKNEDEMVETEGIIMQENEFETENIPEFDPDETSQEENIMESETLVSVPSRRNDVTHSRNKVHTLRVKDSSQMMVRLALKIS